MEEQKYKKIDYGLETVLKRIKPENYKPFTYGFREEKPDFRLEKTLNPAFVAPVLTEVSENSNCSIDKARYILIEAVGATGKTELTKKMSNWLQSPIFDLGLTKVVAGNSLTGLLTKRLNLADCFNYMSAISNGESNILIDALDEGYWKTNYQGYLDFLDDVLSLDSKKECPIILLGRYNAIELAATYFISKDVDVCTLQIEPFTLKQANEFLDKVIKTSAKVKYSTTFKDTRDYILQTIEGFFKDQASIKTLASERFIGYAPVLLSIAAFFDENTNYQEVLNELKERNIKSVQLIIDIIRRILERDRCEKVLPFIKDSLLYDRDAMFQRNVMERIYSHEEQCARILYNVMDEPFPEIEIGDQHFLSAYNEHIKIWINEHPFLGKNKIANIVFESYILALLTHSSKYADMAFDYMHINGISYMFAYIYNSLYGFSKLDARLLPYIYESIRQLNNKHNYYMLNIEWDPGKSNDVSTLCDIEFVGSQEGMTNYCGNVSFFNDEAIELGSRLEHLYVDTPLDFKLDSRIVEAAAPSYIKCKNLIINSQEITIHQRLTNSDFMLECQEAKIIAQNNHYLQIGGVGSIKNAFRIVSPIRPAHPLFEYWISGDVILHDMSEEISSLYKKLRGIILEFRSHSKHELAKHHERIDFVMGNNATGRAVIAEMVKKSIMFRRGHLYILNPEVMDEELGLSYDGIRNFEQSDKTLAFLRNVVVE